MGVPGLNSRQDERKSIVLRDRVERERRLGISGEHGGQFQGAVAPCPARPTGGMGSGVGGVVHTWPEHAFERGRDEYQTWQAAARLDRRNPIVSVAGGFEHGGSVVTSR